MYDDSDGDNDDDDHVEAGGVQACRRQVGCEGARRKNHTEAFQFGQQLFKIISSWSDLLMLAIGRQSKSWETMCSKCNKRSKTENPKIKFKKHKTRKLNKSEKSELKNTNVLGDQWKGEVEKYPNGKDPVCGSLLLTPRRALTIC